MSKLNVTKLLSKLNMSNDLAYLSAYYNTPSFLEIIGKERKENVHSDILRWFFDDSDFRSAKVILRFLNLVIAWADEEGINIDKELKKAIYINGLSIEDNYEVIREEIINDDQYGEGRIDITIKCLCKFEKTVKKLNIIIENKIYASETKKSGIPQTQAYYDYYSNNLSNDINIFVYLKPVTTYELNQKILNKKLQEWRSCKEFVVINYQELLSKIIEPVMELSSISERNKFLLQEYIKSLGKTKKYGIMCYTEEEKKLLLSFYNNNKDLIDAVMSIRRDDPDTPLEVKETLNEYSEVQTSQNKEYRVTWTDPNGKEYPEDRSKGIKMPDFAKEFAKYLLINKSKSVEDINSIFIELTESRKDALFFTDQKSKNETYHLTEFVYKGKSYYTQRDWRAQSKDGRKANFPPLLNNIKNKDDYKDFLIEEL